MLQVFTIVVGIVLTGVVLLGLFVIYLRWVAERKTEENVLHFIANNPDQASMFVIENGQVTVNVEGGVKRPLASVVKIMVAAEFAEQVTEGKLSPDERVTLEQLARFYLPHTDGNAHPQWLASLESDTDVHGVSLLEIARGMIKYSSNANTDFLIKKLGIDQVNKRVSSLGMQTHDSMYPLTASMLVYGELRSSNHLSHREATGTMKTMSYEEYAEMATDIAGRMISDPDSIERLHKVKSPRDAQHVWSGKLPSASAEDYAKLLEKIHLGAGTWSSEANAIIQELLEYKPNPDSPYKVIAGKGGSTLSILNQTAYCEDHAGNQFQISVFIHDPTEVNVLWLKKKLDLFLRKYIIDATFRQLANRTLSTAHHDDVETTKKSSA